jgi:hypothetical protein
MPERAIQGKQPLGMFKIPAPPSESPLHESTEILLGDTSVTTPTAVYSSLDSLTLFLSRTLPLKNLMTAPFDIVTTLPLVTAPFETKTRAAFFDMLMAGFLPDSISQSNGPSSLPATGTAISMASRATFWGMAILPKMDCRRQDRIGLGTIQTIDGASIATPRKNGLFWSASLKAFSSYFW